MMLGKYFKKTVFRKEHTADGVVPEAPQGILKKCNACKGLFYGGCEEESLYLSEVWELFSGACVSED